MHPREIAVNSDHLNHDLLQWVPRLLPACYVLAVAVSFLWLPPAIGATWYHTEPGNLRLLWDHLPLSLVFIALPVWMVAVRTRH